MIPLDVSLTLKPDINPNTGNSGNFGLRYGRITRTGDVHFQRSRNDCIDTARSVSCMEIVFIWYISPVAPQPRYDEIEIRVTKN